MCGCHTGYRWPGALFKFVDRILQRGRRGTAYVRCKQPGDDGVAQEVVEGLLR